MATKSKEIPVPQVKPVEHKPAAKNDFLKHFLQDFLIGGISGSIAKTLTAPIDRVKLILQLQKIMKTDGEKYKGIVDCFSKTIKKEGFLSLWRGNMANIIRYFPTQALNFSIKGFVNRTFNPFDSKKEPLKFFLGNLMAGGVAGATSLLFVYPLDFARTRLGVDMGKGKGDRQFTGIFDCCTKVAKKDGISGLYRGFGVSVAGIIVYRALYFGCYDAGKKFIFGDKERQASFWTKWAYAQLVTSVSELVSYPLDTVRRRLMLQSGRKEILYKGTLDCFKKIAVQEGFTGFFKGAFSNFVRSIGSSLVLVLYDEIQNIINPEKVKKSDNKH